MSTKESVHSARSGRSVHSAEETLLVDEDHTSNHKKKTIYVGVLMLLLLVGMGVAIFFAINQGSKRADAEDERDMYEKILTQRVNQVEDEKINKVLNLSGLGLKSISIGISNATLAATGSTIKALNLENNMITQFNNFNLPNLQELVLANNPLNEFNGNIFQELKDFTLPGSTIQSFDGNSLPKVTLLDLSRQSNLTSFEMNTLNETTVFNVPQSLVDLNGNYLPKTSNFDINRLPNLKKFNNNTFNI